MKERRQGKVKALRIGVIGLGDICHAYLSNLQKYPDAVDLYACALPHTGKGTGQKGTVWFSKSLCIRG